MHHPLNPIKDKELGKIGEDNISQLGKSLSVELQRFLPPPVVLPERRLEHLVEIAVTSHIDSYLYHNLPVAVSLYENHCCGRDRIPTKTVQVCFLLLLKLLRL